MKRVSNIFRSLKFSEKSAIIFLLLICLMAIFAGVIADHKPLYVNVNGQHLFPALSNKKIVKIQDQDGNKIRINYDLTNWREIGNSAIFPPIPYSPSQADYNNSNFVSPTAFQSDIDSKELTGNRKHLLGTDKLGRDVFSGIIHGSRISLIVGFLSMLIAMFVGLALGSIAAYYGDSGITLKRGTFILLVISLFFSWFFAFKLRSETIVASLASSYVSFFLEIMISVFYALLISVLFYLLGNLLSTGKFLKKKVCLPIDKIISRLIEIFVSVPKLILIISIAAISKSSITMLILIIALSSWTEFARLTRAEVLRIRELDFLNAGKSLGLSDVQLIARHILPNAITPILIAFAFGVASAIIVESSLSFLGIGVPRNIVTWGSLLATGSANFKAWWLVLFPGLALFLTVISINILAESGSRLRESNQ